MRVHVVDPSAYTPPYDHALCRALGAAGAEVELYTSRFAHGPVAARRRLLRAASCSTALAARVRDARARRAVKLVEHVPDMLRYRRAARAADVVHFQWLTVQHLDGHLLPDRAHAPSRRRPLVLTAHDILPREAGPGQRAAQRRLYERFDAIVVHSEHGRRRLTDELGVDPRARARDPARRVRAPRRRRTGATRRPRQAPFADRQASRPVLRADAPVQGHRPAARGLARDRRTRSCGSRACRGWTSPRCAPRRRPACASCRASSATTSCRRTSAAPTSSCCPTARSTSRGCCSRRSRSASRCC